MVKSEEEIVDLLNTIISAQGASKRIIIWHSRLLKEMRKIEGWLRYEQSLLEKKETEDDS
jgi:hypothetical protein